jgi:sigma-B regulation protein RsbU (phosphoserine phosphatase)
MKQAIHDERDALLDSYRKQIASLENELDEMTVALSHSWDQLVPFLQGTPEQVGAEADFTPIIQAAMAGTEADFGAIYLFDGEWISVPDVLSFSTAREQILQENLRQDSPLQWDEPLPGKNKHIHWIFTPIILDQKMIGAFGIGHSQNDRQFTALELRILVRMADRIANQIVAAELASSRQREAAAAREMEIASMIQRSIQPKDAPKHPALRLASFWQPAKRVGGDAWGWIQDTDGRFSWFLLDVAGKGLPAALASMSLHTALSMGLRMGLPLDELMKRINEQFYDSFSDTDFLATVVLISVEPRSGILKQVNAGHLPTLIRQGEHWISLPATAPPIGVLPMLNVEIQKMPLGAQDLIMTYSDGYTEIETSNGLWGDQRLKDAIPAGDIAPVAAIEAVNEAAQKAALLLEQHDDRTLIIANLI